MNIAGTIDHTQLKAEATLDQIDQLISEAVEYNFASVCINGSFIKHVADKLKAAGASAKACSVVGFPLGAMKTSVKAMEAVVAAKDGAKEIDMVAHLPTLLAKDVASAKAEYMEVVKAVRSVDPQIVVKVIVESGCLMAEVDAAEAEARIEAACQAVRESGADFIKTSTGFHPTGGATVEAVNLMRKHAGGLKVKASGGIRSYDDAKMMLDAGADRLGCSAGVAIVKGESAGAGTY